MNGYRFSVALVRAGSKGEIHAAQNMYESINGNGVYYVTTVCGIKGMGREEGSQATCEKCVEKVKASS